MKNTNDKSLETGTFWLYISGTAKDKGYMTLDILNISTQKIKRKKITSQLNEKNLYTFKISWPIKNQRRLTMAKIR
jgi:hypothetical protein